MGPLQGSPSCMPSNHGFTELHQLDTFYNALNPADQDSLNSATSGNLLERRTQDVLTIIKKTNPSVLVLDGPSVPMPPLFINPEEDERVEETLTDPKLAEYTIKVPPPLVQKAKPPSQRNYVMHQRDPRNPYIPYPSRMNQEKQQEKDEVQIHKFWQMFKQLHINITLANALILIPKYQKMLKSLLSNKEKLLDLANTPLNENCSAVILKKLPEKLGDPGKFLILYGFSELKCKSLADLGASINLMPLSEMDSILEDSVDKGNLADPNNDLVDTIPEMFTDEHTLDYSSPPLYDDVDNDLVELAVGLCIVSSDFLPFPECDSVFYEDFSEVDALSSTNNEDKVFNPVILIHENLFEVTNYATPEENVKKTTNASLILEDFNPPLYELPFHKEVLWLRNLLSFSSGNKEKVFNPGILTSKGIHTSLLLELSHQDPKTFKVIKIFENPMEIFPCSYGEDIRVLDVPSLHFYPF
ncbi:hypothetical protein Tco_0360896 [Tanacetum coccineum]